MLALEFAAFDLGVWTSWGVPIGAGAVVTSVVIGSAVVYSRWRRRPAPASKEEDLPWAGLHRLLLQHNPERAAAGLPPEEPTAEVLGKFLATLPAVPAARPTELPEDLEFLALGGDERRVGRRRWGNPTEVRLRSPLWYDSLHA